MLDPGTLYELAPDLQPGGQPVLVQALTGFVDAGGAGRLAREHLFATLEHRVVATFDLDQLFDYRSRRPFMLLVEDHWQSYDDPVLALYEMRDTTGVRFYLLAGPEPDLQWERFVAAVTQLVETLGVRLVVGLNSIPMAVPHTRPIGVTAHGTRPELVAGHEPWVQTVQVPASAAHLLEYRLGQAGRDAMGFAVHVPHYVAQVDYAGAAEVLLTSVAGVTGLVLPTGGLHEAAEQTRAEIDEQVARSSEVLAVVRALEEQYDVFVRGRASGGLLVQEGEGLPSGDELGAELERFLAEQSRPDDSQG